MLVVEDDPSFERLVHAALATTSVPFDVDVVDTLEAAIRAITTKKYNVALLDLGLPDSSGEATVEAMHAANAAVPIVVVTGNDDDRTALSALANGAHSFLRKSNLSTTNLMDAMHHAVRQQLKSDRQPEYSELKVKRLFQAVQSDITKINGAVAQLEACHLDPIGRDAVSIIRSQARNIVERVEGFGKQSES